jgi:hypothetical protein
MSGNIIVSHVAGAVIGDPLWNTVVDADIMNLGGLNYATNRKRLGWAFHRSFKVSFPAEYSAAVQRY